MMRMRGLAFGLLLARCARPLRGPTPSPCTAASWTPSPALAIATAEVTAGSARATTDRAGAFALALGARARGRSPSARPATSTRTRRLTVGAVPPPLRSTSRSYPRPGSPRAPRGQGLARPRPPSPAPCPSTPERVLAVAGALDNVYRTPPDPARRGGHRGVRQPPRGPRRVARSEPHGDGRRRNPRPVSPVRADQRLQSRNHSALRIGHWRLQRQVRRSAVVAAGGREPRRRERTGPHRLRLSQHHRRERRVRRKVAGRRGRLLAGDRPPYVLRPGRRAHHRPNFPPSPTCRPRSCGNRPPAAGSSLFGLAAGRRPRRDRRRRRARRIPDDDTDNDLAWRRFDSPLGTRAALPHRGAVLGHAFNLRRRRGFPRSAAAVECPWRRSPSASPMWCSSGR